MSHDEIKTVTSTSENLAEVWERVTGSDSEDGTKRHLDTLDPGAASVAEALDLGGSKRTDDEEGLSLLSCAIEELKEINFHLRTITGEKYK